MPCIERDADDGETLELALIENMQRKDLTPFEEADGVQALGDRFGLTHEEIARKISQIALLGDRTPEPSHDSRRDQSHVH